MARRKVRKQRRRARGRRINPASKKRRAAAAPSTHLRPMRRAGTVTTTAATRRRSAKRALRRGAGWGPGFASRAARAFPPGAGGWLVAPGQTAGTVTWKPRTKAQQAATRKLIAHNRKRKKSRARKATTRTRRFRFPKGAGGWIRRGRRTWKARTPAQQAATRKLIALNRRKGRKSRPAAKAAARRSRKGYPAISARASYSGTGRPPKGFRSRRRAASRRRKAGHKNLSAIRPIRRGQRIAGLVRRNPRKRRNGGQVMARHRHHRRRRRHNPAMGGIMSTAKRTIAAAIPSVAGGALMSLIDSKLLADRPLWMRVGGKIVAAAGAGMLLRRRPDTAKLLMGAMLGSLGYELGAKLSGGLVTANKAQTVQALGTLIRADPQAMGALVDATGAYIPAFAGSPQMVDSNLG
jgi:hypothetical protein